MILPEETGVYEFVVKTRNGVTLWVNDHDRGEESGGKTIDGWVAPNNDVREETGSIYLIGGRPYPIRLDFFTHKEKAASVELLWKTPHGVLETIPERNLAPEWAHESLLVDVPFPADDRSVGYERGTMVSKAWLEAVTAGAAMASDYVVEHLDELAKLKRDQPEPERQKNIHDFAEKFVARAFRRPLSEEEKERFVRKHFKENASPDQAVKRLVLQTLSSARFLYPEVGGPEKPDQWTIASRLALLLWDSVPNERLLDRVNKGELNDPGKFDQVVNEAVWNWRTRIKMRGFYHQWLEMERADELVKDKGAFPEFDPAIAADLRTSLYAFLDEATWGKEKAGYRELLLSSAYPMNERLGKVYGADVKGGFQPVTLDGGKARRTHHPPLRALLPRLSQQHFADPPRRLPDAPHHRHAPEIAAHGERVQGQQIRPEPDDARKSHLDDQVAGLHGLPRHDQSARLQPRALRRDRSLAREGSGQAGRRQGRFQNRGWTVPRPGRSPRRRRIRRQHSLGPSHLHREPFPPPRQTARPRLRRRRDGEPAQGFRAGRLPNSQFDQTNRPDDGPTRQRSGRTVCRQVKNLPLSPSLPYSLSP
jgi:hypothetical protein